MQNLTTISTGEQGWQDGLSVLYRQKKLFLSSHLSDVTFYVNLIENPEDQMSVCLDQLKPIPAHKLILACGSPVFEKMFFGSMAKESNPSEVKVLDIRPEVFISMLRFIYCEEVTVEEAYPVETLYAYKKYMLLELVTPMTSYLMYLIIRCIKKGNIFKIFEQVQKFEAVDLDMFIQTMIQFNTKSLLDDESFLHIQRSTLEFILLQPKLNISEIDLLHACIRWARAECGRNGIVDDPQPEQLRQVLGDLRYLVRIFSFNTKTFLNKACQTMFTKEEMLEVISNLELINELKDTFVPELISKFDSTARIFGGPKWHRYATNSAEKFVFTYTLEFENLFSFGYVVYLYGIGLKNYKKDLKVDELIIQNQYGNSRSFKNVNLNENKEILFDFPIILRPAGKFIEIHKEEHKKVDADESAIKRFIFIKIVTSSFEYIALKCLLCSKSDHIGSVALLMS